MVDSKIDMSLNDIIKKDTSEELKNNFHTNNGSTNSHHYHGQRNESNFYRNKKADKRDEYPINIGLKRGFRREDRRGTKYNIGNKYDSNQLESDGNQGGKLIKVSNLHKAINNEDLRVSSILS
jgi:hypothetical protein